MGLFGGTSDGGAAVQNMQQQAAVQQGESEINQNFAGFNPAFYQQAANDYTNAVTPGNMQNAGDVDKAQKLEDQVQGHADDLGRLPPKMVERIRDELTAKGELPKMQEFKPDAGRTLQAMTDALNKSESDSPKVSLADRFNIAKKAADTYTASKDFVSKAWGNSVAASKALWSVFKSAPMTGDFKEVMKSWIGYDTRTSIENARYAKVIVDKVTQKVRRMGMRIWLDAHGDENILKFQRDSVPDKNHKDTKYRDIWNAALKLTDYEKQKAQEIKADFAHKLDDGQAVGIIGKGREDYSGGQSWKEAPQIDRDADLNAEGKKGKPGNPYAKLDPRDPFFSFSRETPSYFDGIMAGGEPKNLDIAHEVSVYDEAFHKALSSRGAIKALSEATAADGQPVVKLSGKADLRTGDNPGVFVDSKSLPKDAVAADGRPYQSVDHWALRDWKFAAKDSSGKPIMVRGDMLAHPDHVDFLKNELNTPRWMTKDAAGIEKVGRYALQASTYLKASKFIGPFHIVTEALHASFHGVVPSVKDFDIDLNDPKQALLSRNMMIDMGRAREMYDDGIRSAGGGIWKHVPGLGDAIVRMNNFTFNEYIPRLKMKVGLAVLDRNMARYKGKLTDDQIAELTGRQMDAAFGGQNWRLMGANKGNNILHTQADLV